MANPHGSFVWYELLTADADAAQRFYADVVGWSVADSGMAGTDYRILAAPDGDRIGGLMIAPADSGPPAWYGYVEVADVDAAVAGVEAAGGTARTRAMDVPEVGRMAMLADPQGAAFYVIASAQGDPSRAFQDAQRATPGHAVWNEIAAADPDAAIAFYTGQFGWTQEGAMPMGSLGDYRFLHHAGTAIGAAMPVVLTARPGWQVYFHVPDIDAAAARVRAGGGATIQGPDPIPGGSFALVAEDPAGARFGLVGPREGA